MDYTSDLPGNISLGFYANVLAAYRKEALHKFGRNPVVTGDTTEDVWDGGGLWVPPTEARVHNLVSSSANDAAAGTGARTIKIYGLDANYDRQEETITLNGVTPVATTNSYTRIFRMVCQTWGSGQANAGNITATAVTDATVTAQVSTGNNQTLMAIYTVPNGYSLILYTYWFFVNATAGIGAVKDSYANCKILASDATNPGRVVKQFISAASAAGPAVVDFHVPQIYTEKTDIIAQADAVIEDADVSCVLCGVLHKNDIVFS